MFGHYGQAAQCIECRRHRCGLYLHNLSYARYLEGGIAGLESLGPEFRDGMRCNLLRFLGFIEEERGNDPRAAELFREVVESWSRTLGTDHRWSMDARARLEGIERRLDSSLETSPKKPIE